jgi:hypothetical protein
MSASSCVSQFSRRFIKALNKQGQVIVFLASLSFSELPLTIEPACD